MLLETIDELKEKVWYLYNSLSDFICVYIIPFAVSSYFL